MPSTDSPAVIVARFLKANHYSETFEAFVKEAGLKEDDGAIKPGDWTLEKIVEEKTQYDQSLNFERRFNDGNQGWTVPAPSKENESTELGTTANVLSIGVSMKKDRLYVTSADRRWRELSPVSPYNVLHTEYELDGSPILSSVSLPLGMVALTTMSGSLLLHHIPSGKTFQKRRDHSKYAVQVAVRKWNDDLWVLATVGWDQKVNLYVLDMQDDPQNPEVDDYLKEPFHSIQLPTNPESILLVTHPDTGNLYLVVARRDSTHLYYYAIEGSHTSRDNILQLPVVREEGKQNLAPHSNAWVAFTPSCLAQNPKDESLIAVATSHLPHMKLIIVRLLFPGTAIAEVPGGTQASQARAALAVQDREDAAIRLQVATMAPQTPYSTPQVVWRPNGSGVWVNGDDGVVRGIEVQTGKVVSLLKGHEAGTKVRTLWAGMVGDREANQEVLLSGGFDKKLLIWTAEQPAE